MRAVVTGATGFVGTWLVKELLKQNDEVTIIVRDKKKVQTEWLGKVEVVEASLEQLQNLTSCDFAQKTADIFFHLAWAGMSREKRADIDLQLENIRATAEAVKLAKKLCCKRFVYAGSIMEYEAIQYVTSDDGMAGMGSIYSVAKVTGDYIAKTLAVQECMEYINVIISNIYGAGEKSERFLNTTLRKMLRNEEIAMTHGTQLYDFIYVTDAVKAILLVAKEGRANASYYIGNAEQRMLRDYVLEMKSVLHSNSELLFGAIPFAGTMLTYKEFDTKKLQEMGFMPEVSFEEGIIRTRDWILSNLEG